MKPLRIFISSPGDVEEERERARQVVEGLRRRYAGRFYLKPVLWEDLPLQADMSFQDGIDLVLSDEHGIDVAVFILWSRMGQLQDGGEYRSGTEREFGLMRAARDQSEGKRRPALFVYTRSDDTSFSERLRGKPTPEQQDLIGQKAAVEQFIEETFQDKTTGKNLRAFHGFDRPTTFSRRLRVHLTEHLDELAGGTVETVWDTDKQGPPFPGLEAFEPEHADVFFGREDEILEARNALRTQARNGCAFLLLSGASGSGKSSLARAGVLPAIVELEVDEEVAEWRTLIVTPSELGSDPIQGLVKRIACEGVLPQLRGDETWLETLSDGLRKDAELTCDLRIKDAFKEASRKRQGGVRLLLVIDQLEEFFSSAVGHGEFFDVVEALARSGPVWVVATVRADFYPQVQDEPVLVRMKAGAGQLDVLPPGPDALRRLIEEPARLAGLVFEETEGRSLADRLLVEAAPHAELLPLIEFVLRELYERRTEKGVLTFDAYQALGSDEEETSGPVILGALAKRAEETYRALPGASQEVLGEVLEKLVTLGEEEKETGGRSKPLGEERLVRQHAALSQFPEGSPSRSVVDRFVAGRLFTADHRREGDDSTVTVAHESLLRAWPRAVQWAEQNKDLLRTRARVAARMKEESPLLGGDPLLEAAKSHLSLREESFTVGQRDYIRDAVAAVEAGERRAATRRRFAFAALGVLTLVALGAAVWAGVKQRETVAERDQARHNEGLGWLLRAEVAEKEGNRYPDTLLYAAKAIGFEGFGRPEEAAESVRLITEARDPEVFARAREWIAGRPAYLPLWSSKLRPEAPATALAVAPSGRWLALGSAEGVRLHDLETGEARDLPDLKQVTDLTFDPLGEVLAIAAAGAVRSWRVAEGDFGPDWEYPLAEPGSISALSWSPGGDVLAGVAEDCSVLVWTGSATEPTRIPAGAAGPSDPSGDETQPAPRQIASSPDNAFFASLLPGAGPQVIFPEHGASALAWTALDASRAEEQEDRDRAAFLRRVERAKAAACLAVSPDGMRLATGDGGGGVSLWDATRADLVGEASPELRHPGGVVSLAWRGDGGQIASGAADGTIRLWQVEGTRLLLEATLTGHVGVVRRLAYGPGGGLLVSAGADGSAKLWEVSGSREAGRAVDLYAYLHSERPWYGIDEAAAMAWASGEGHAGGAESEKVLAAWRPTVAGDPVASFVADAAKAAADRRWRRVGLRALELGRLGAALPEEIASAMVAALPPCDPEPQKSFVNGEGMALIWCPPTGPEGFRMGSPEDEPGRLASEGLHRRPLTRGLRIISRDEQPGRLADESLHRKALNEGFWLGKYEVTQAEWLSVMGSNPSTNQGSGLNAPVETVSWYDAEGFCQRLTDRERARGTIPVGWGYRLPTEAQWEYACRAGTEKAYSFGDDPAELHRHGNYNEISGNFVGNDSEYDDGHQYTAPAGSYLPNPWGFHDMHGNVWEWCRDTYVAYRSDRPADPYTASGPNRVLRGGSFLNTSEICRSANRNANLPTYRSNALGLRVALAPSVPVSPSDTQAAPPRRTGQRAERVTRQPLGMVVAGENAGLPAEKFSGN